MTMTSKIETTAKTKIILFEGIDGAGKSYLLSETKKRLIQKNHTVLTLSNPYGQSKSSWSSRLHSLISKEKFCPLTQATLYAGIIMENQKIYRDKRYDYVLIDRYIHSTFAYNIFYPALNGGMAPPLQDPTQISRSLSKIFCSSVRCSGNLPCLTFVIKSGSDNFNLPGFNLEILEESYKEAEFMVEKIYRSFSKIYRQETIYNKHENTDAIENVMEKIFQLPDSKNHDYKQM